MGALGNDNCTATDMVTATSTSHGCRGRLYLQRLLALVLKING